MPSHLTSEKTPFNINSLMYTYDSTSLLKNSSSRSCNTSGVTPSIIDCKSIIPPHLSSRKIKKRQPKKVVLGKPCTGKQKMSSEALKELSRQASLHSSSSLPLNQEHNSYLNHRPLSSDIMSISRNLRTNLSKAKSKLMSTLKSSDIPEEIEMYKSLYNSSLSSLFKQTAAATTSSLSLSSFNNTLSSSSLSSTASVSSLSSSLSTSYTSDEPSYVHVRLVTDDTGSVSIVSDHALSERLSPMCATDYGSSDDDTTVLTSTEEENYSYLFNESKEKDTFNYIPPHYHHQGQEMQQDMATIDNMNMLLQSWKLENPSSLLSKNDELRDVTEDQIDSWLQRGGGSGDHHPMVMATDQELADLLDFDI